MKNLTKIKTIIADFQSSLSQKLTREQKLDLADDTFVGKIRDMVACTDPIYNIINTSQKFQITVADSCELWLKFEEELETLPVAPEYQTYFKSQFEKKEKHGFKRVRFGCELFAPIILS